MVRRGLHALPTHRPHRRARRLRLVRATAYAKASSKIRRASTRRRARSSSSRASRHRRRCGHRDAHPAPETVVRGTRRRPQGAQGRDGRDRRRARASQAREGGARGPPPLHDLHGGRRAAGRRLRAVRPLPRLRLVRRRAPGVPQLPRDDHDAHDDRELNAGSTSTVPVSTNKLPAWPPLLLGILRVLRRHDRVEHGLDLGRRAFFLLRLGRRFRIQLRGVGLFFSARSLYSFRSSRNSLSVNLS